MQNTFGNSDRYLSEIPFHVCEYLPVTCSYMFAAANIVAAGDRCRGLYGPISTFGRIDQEKTMQLCPSWKKPLTDGIPCIVFRRELDIECPELAEFLAAGPSRTVHLQESKVQFLLTIHDLINTTVGSAPLCSPDKLRSIVQEQGWGQGGQWTRYEA